MTIANPLRLFVDAPKDGAVNMAVDGCLLEESSAGVASLRLYRWAEPTLSLGYFQEYDDAARKADGLADLPVVRRWPADTLRPTRGSAATGNASRSVTRSGRSLRGAVTDRRRGSAHGRYRRRAG